MYLHSTCYPTRNNAGRSQEHLCLQRLMIAGAAVLSEQHRETVMANAGQSLGRSEHNVTAGSNICVRHYDGVTSSVSPGNIRNTSNVSSMQGPSGCQWNHSRISERAEHNSPQLNKSSYPAYVLLVIDGTWQQGREMFRVSCVCFFIS